ncbi:MAG: 7-cyano-7-deazaguanine synthase [Deltaproteobacteria bacterium]|nr:7-cyano-7-deazaguanine synthase [Deltaproteobacteria bacterium]
MDSAAALHFHVTQAKDTEALFVDYGQQAATWEYASARAIAKRYRVRLRRVRAAGLQPPREGYIQGRNAFLIMTAVMALEPGPALVATGVHAGTPYYDCSQGFFTAMQTVLDGYSDGQLVLSTPFLGWTKRMIQVYCVRHRVPIHLTRSCQSKRRKPCGTCVSCRDREALDARS